MLSILASCLAGAIGLAEGASASAPTKAPIEIVYRVDVDGSATDVDRAVEVARDLVTKRVERLRRRSWFVTTASVRVETREGHRLVVTATGAGADAEFLDAVRERVASAVGAQFRIVIPEERYAASDRLAKERLAKRIAESGAQVDSLTSDDLAVPPHRFVPLAAGLRRDDATRAFPFVLIDDDPAGSFGSADLERTYATPDASGHTGIGFELRADRATAFGEFTGAHLHDRLAVVVSGRVVSMPQLNGAIADHGIIEGGASGFRPDELRHLSAWIQPGALPSDVHLTEIP